MELSRNNWEIIYAEVKFAPCLRVHSNLLKTMNILLRIVQTFFQYCINKNNPSIRLQSKTYLNLEM